MTPGNQVDPLAAACPHCEAAPGEVCLKPDGEDAPRPHARRARAAERDAIEARKRAENSAPDRIEGDRWRRLYVACRLELEQRGQWTKLAAEQLEVLARTMSQADTAREACEREPVVKGSTGQPVPNGLWSTMRTLDAQALAIARALKLTPDTRGTSAGNVDDELPAGVGADDEPAERDDLAVLDQLAEKRKAKAAKRAG